MRGNVDKYRVGTKHPDTGKYERWRIRWELPPDPYTGERRQGGRRGFPTRKAAEQELASTLGQVHAGTYVSPSRQRIAAYLTAWLEGLRVKPTTLANYRQCVHVHIIPRVGGVPLVDLTAEQIDGLYRELERHGKAAGKCRTAGITCREHGCAPEQHDGLAPKSVRHVHVALRKALQDAVDRGYIGRNVADLANPPRQKDTRGRRARDKAWTTEELRRFLDAIEGHRLAPVWQLIATTGMRRAEVCGLRWSDVDLDRGRLRISRTVVEVSGFGLVDQEDGKTDAAERAFALDARTVASLRTWKARQTKQRLAASPGGWEDTGFVFTRADGTGHRPKRLSSQFTEVVDAVGLPRIGMHGLRHTYATAALRAGVSPEVVSKRLGHASVVVTLSIYAHVFEQDDQAAAEQVANAIYGA